MAGSFADHPAAFLLCIYVGDAWHPLIERCFSGRFNRFKRQIRSRSRWRSS